MQRRNGRAVECGGLENRCPGDRTGGSNPSSSATPLKMTRLGSFFFIRSRCKLKICIRRRIKKTDLRIRSFSEGLFIPLPGSRAQRVIPEACQTCNLNHPNSRPCVQAGSRAQRVIPEACQTSNLNNKNYNHHC